jgi:hypothetical protein
MAAFTTMAMVGATAIGVGMQGYGALQGSRAARRSAEADRAIAAQEQRAEAVRMQAMELDARRRKLEIVRTQQRARSLSLASATAQGAQYGSGLQGGYGQIGGMTGFNELGVNQNLYQGREMFGINSVISGLKMQKADAQGQMATAQGISSLGGSIMNSAQGLSNFAGGFGGFGGASRSSMSSYGGQILGMGRGGIY